MGLGDNAYVLDNSFYVANSARICDSTNKQCKCSAITEQCTGETICHAGGTCRGKYKNPININRNLKR